MDNVKYCRDFKWERDWEVFVGCSNKNVIDFGKNGYFLV